MQVCRLRDGLDALQGGGHVLRPGPGRGDVQGLAAVAADETGGGTPPDQQEPVPPSTAGPAEHGRKNGRKNQGLAESQQADPPAGPPSYHGPKNQVQKPASPHASASHQLL
jgi:hypothetical protein